MPKQNCLLEVLSDEDIEWLISAGEVIQICKDSILIEEGKSGDSLYIVLGGVFTVNLAILQNQSVAHVLSGDILGEMSFVDERPPSATVQAKEDAEVFRIYSQVLSEKLENDFAFASRFFRGTCVVLADRLRDTLNPQNTPQMPTSSQSRIENIISRIRRGQ